MPLWIRDQSAVPKERWHYPSLVAGKPIYAPNYNALYPEVVKHYSANNAAIPGEQEVIDWMCANLSIPCVEGNQPLINRWMPGLPGKAPTCCGKR